MAGSKDFDIVIKNIKVVRPNATIVGDVDTAIKTGKFAKIAPNIAVGKAKSNLMATAA
jgi:dihydroorotase-like cyclic amidohydrolase